MRPLDAASRLRELLERDGVEFTDSGRELEGTGDDWRRVWAAFCELAREPADEPFEQRGRDLRIDTAYAANDLLLHEAGESSRGGGFWLSVTRQFSFADEEGDYAGMNALIVEFQLERPPSGRIPTAQRWGYAGPRRKDVSDESHAGIRNWAGWVDSWARAVEASNSFKLLETSPPDRWVVVQSDM